MRSTWPWIALAWAGVAHAGGIEPDALTARELARAGASTVSEGSGLAVARNPAGLARATSPRVLAAATLTDVDRELTADSGGVTVANRAVPRTLPALALTWSWSRVAAGVLLATDLSYRVDTQAPAFGQPPEEVAALFPHRYAATQLSAERQTAGVGAAVRVSSWLALGAAASASRVAVRESRHVWAGFSGVTPVGDPRRDLAVRAAGEDRFVPALALGVLAIPESLPIELAAAVTWRATAAVTGEASLTETRVAGEPVVTGRDSPASLRLPAPLQVRLGARWLGERWSLEANADLWLRSGEPGPWTMALAAAQPGVTGRLERMDSAVSSRDHAALRAAVDLELIPDFVWLHAGYAVATAATRSARASIALDDARAHRVGLGVEAYWNELTLVIAYARTLARERVLGVGDPQLAIVNPFDGGSGPAAVGRYRDSTDTVGLALEIAW